MAELPPALQSDQDAVVVRHRPEGATSAPSTLEYFVLRGPAEVCRLMLEVTATPYDGIMYFDGGRAGLTQTPWDVRKLDSQLGYMPIYTGPELPPGMQLSESGAIVRHLARQNGLDGADAGERCQADMIFEASKGIPLIVGGWRADDALLADGDLSRMQAQLTRIQKLLEANTAGTPLPSRAPSVLVALPVSGRCCCQALGLWGRARHTAMWECSWRCRCWRRPKPAPSPRSGWRRWRPSARTWQRCRRSLRTWRPIGACRCASRSRGARAGRASSPPAVSAEPPRPTHTPFRPRNHLLPPDR